MAVLWTSRGSTEHLILYYLSISEIVTQLLYKFSVGANIAELITPQSVDREATILNVDANREAPPSCSLATARSQSCISTYFVHQDSVILAAFVYHNLDCHFMVIKHSFLLRRVVTVHRSIGFGTVPFQLISSILPKSQ